MNCKFEGCHRKSYVVTTGFCRSHHGQYRRAETMRPLRGGKKTCAHEGCTSLAQSKGYCRVHYMQFWKYGETYGPGSPVECSAVNCQRPVAAAGLCQRHFANGAEWEIEGSDTRCFVSGCENTAYRGLCRGHKGQAQKYGLSFTQYLTLTDIKECEACGSTAKLDIHHDHNCCNFSGSCGKCVVAMLCGPCNRGAGVMKDDPERLRRVASILERGPFFS